MSKSLVERFYKKIEDYSDPNKCWEWIAAKSYGYGRIQQGKKLAMAHRVSWQLFNGAIPEGLYVCHHCDNPSCVNPGHLFLGTNKDNMRDASEKGRLSGWKHKEETKKKISLKQKGEKGYWHNHQFTKSHKEKLSLNNASKNNNLPKGAYCDQRDKIWYSHIRHKGRMIYLGRFKNKREAYKAYWNKFLEFYKREPWDENKYQVMN